MLTFMADLDISSIASEARNRRLSQQKGGKNEFWTQQRGVKLHFCPNKKGGKNEFSTQERGVKEK